MVMPLTRTGVYTKTRPLKQSSIACLEKIKGKKTNIKFDLPYRTFTTTTTVLDTFEINFENEKIIKLTSSMSLTLVW